MHEDDWRVDAACLDVDPDMFFADRDRPGFTKYAREICGRCPSIKPCLAFGLKFDQPGIYGGTSQYERRQMRSVA